MIFMQIFLVIFLLGIVIFKFYNINKKMKQGEELTDVQNFVLNFGTGFINILFFVIKSIIGFILPFMMFFLPTVLVLLSIVSQVSMELIPYAVIVAAVISLFMYIMIVIVCAVGRRKKRKIEKVINE